MDKQFKHMDGNIWDKFTEWHFPSNKVISNYMLRLKSANLGWPGHALFVPAINNLSQDLKKIFLFWGSYEFLAMLEGKMRKDPYSIVQYCKIIVWIYDIKLKNVLQNK